jgi:23S rRNA pseudouridine1911/1915/1917 synthase
MASEPVVLHRTEGWLVLSKPQGWHVMALREGESRCVEAWLREHVPAAAALPECGLVHRLDVGTTGCLVAALTKEDRARLREAFSNRNAAEGPAVRKTYWAIVRRGIAPTGKFSLYFSGRHKRSAKVTVRPRGEPNEHGECSWHVVGPSRYLGHDIVEVELLGPGRRHQIRAGLAYGGHPLLGDSIYGGSVGAPCAVLHALRIQVDGVTVEAPPDGRFVKPSEPSPRAS